MKYCERHRQQYHVQCAKCTADAGGVFTPVDQDPADDPAADPSASKDVPKAIIDRIKRRARIFYSGGHIINGMLRRTGFIEGGIDYYRQMVGDEKTACISFETWRRQQKINCVEIEKGVWTYSIERKTPEGSSPRCFAEEQQFTLEQLYEFYAESTGKK